MARNGSGVFAVVTPILVGATRSSSTVNGDFSDMGTEITNTVPLDGQAGLSGQCKAFAGTQTAPGIAFASDTNVGFRQSAPDEMRWVAGGQDRFYVDASGKVWQLGAVDIAGACVINGALSGSNDVAAIEALSGTGLLRRTGTDAWSLDDGTHHIQYCWDALALPSLTGGAAVDIQIPYACTITGVELLSNTAGGNCVVTLWKDTYANFPPTSADNICGTTPPTLASANKYVDTTLTGWTTSIAAGDIIRATLSTAPTVNRLQMSLKVRRYT